MIHKDNLYWGIISVTIEINFKPPVLMSYPREGIYYFRGTQPKVEHCRLTRLLFKIKLINCFWPNSTRIGTCMFILGLITRCFCFHKNEKKAILQRVNGRDAPIHIFSLMIWSQYLNLGSWTGGVSHNSVSHWATLPFRKSVISADNVISQTLLIDRKSLQVGSEISDPWVTLVSDSILILDRIDPIPS